MSGVSIYMEGGGDSRDNKAALRQGMDAFLGPIKDAARQKTLRWKLVACGGRQQAYDAFINASRDADYPIRILLVDAEDPLADAPREHLRRRDGWDLMGVEDSVVQLMTQTMETWIVADRASLVAFYGQGFHGGSLPNAANLEEVAKATVAAALEQATRNTSKGAYHKIRHASVLLQRIDPMKVRARCRSCDRLFTELSTAIGGV
jgi:hypothetical protein